MKLPDQEILRLLPSRVREHAWLGASLLILGLSYAAIRMEPASFPIILTAQILLFLTVIHIVAFGADMLVNAASHIAEKLGLSQLMIGLTVVAFGTSAPEGAVSLVAGFQGNGDITIANVVGSNIFNLCFILGTMAFINPKGLPIRAELTRRDAPILLLATVMLFLFVGGNPFGESMEGVGFSWLRLLNLRLEAGEGVLLALALVAYLIYLYRMRKPDAEAAVAEGAAAPESSSPAQESSSLLRDCVVFTIGLAMMVKGCDLLVGHAEPVADGFRGLGAVWFAKQLNISDYVIGVTIVAAGTSTHEFIVSIVAAWKGRFDMTVGNLIGSDLFNMLGVVGVAGMVLQQPLAPPVTVAPAVIGSLLALSALVALTWMLMWTGGRLSRWEGALLIMIGIGRWTMDFLTQPGAAP
ncbi:MAG: calcium/sodium antiporter [SAR324 cluster bacterium]|nr:calcium/sodium antiporter [SAR324 cluster bacterium]